MKKVKHLGKHELRIDTQGNGTHTGRGTRIILENEEGEVVELNHVAKVNINITPNDVVRADLQIFPQGVEVLAEVGSIIIVDE